MIVGMDFGTTNSGMAVYDGQKLRRLPLDEGSDSPRILRSALYITNEQDVYIGRTAIDRYFEHNVGRPVKLERVLPDPEGARAVPVLERARAS